MTQEEKARAYDEALNKAKIEINTKGIGEAVDLCYQLFPELAESEDESLKNKSGYYKAGKFWKASTLWNATKNKIPQRVSNRYILQECTWNIGNLQDFANEVKNVQEVSLDYPIILDMNGNITDGAHRVVKAYLEGKDIDIVYIGDDEWPEPDYDEEKAVKESEDERIRKRIVKFIDEQYPTHGNLKEEKDKMLAYLEKQKEEEGYEAIPVESTLEYKLGFKAGKESENQKESLRDFIDDFPYSDEQKEQKPLTDEEKEYIRTIKSIISDFIRDKKPEDLAYYQRIYDWLDGRHVPFSCGHENGKPADPVFSKQEYESHPIISTDTTSAKPAELDGKALLYTADKSYQIGFRDGVASVKPAEWSKDDERRRDGIIQWLREYQKKFNPKYDSLSIESIDSLIDWFKSLRPQYHGDVTVTEAYKMGLEAGKASSWKPSEEQMDSLRDTIANTKGYSYSIYLPELYEQLKKLI